MQPDQPNPSPAGGPQTPQPGGLNVPDYLQLEPIPDAAEIKSKKRKKTTAILGIVLLITIIVATLGYLFWLQGEPERQFYQSLENLMNLKYVNQQFSEKTDNPKSTLLVTQSLDFTNTKDTKNQIEYSLSYTPYLSSTPTIVNGKQITTTDSSLFVSFNQFPRNPFTQNISKDNWYKLSTDNVQNLSMLDPLGLRDRNKTFPEGLFEGNFSNQERLQIIDTIKTQKTFSFSSNGEQSVGNRQARVYKVTTDYKKLAKLYDAVAKISGSKYTFQYSDSNPATFEYTIWVDSNTSEIIKLTGVKKSGNLLKPTTYTLTMSYPTTLSISEPPAVPFNIKKGIL